MQNNMDVRLSDHFSLWEFTKSQTAKRMGIDNHAPEQGVVNLTEVAHNILEPVRRHYGVAFSPSSAYRSAALNEAIGSKPTSQHIVGEAVDFELPCITNRDLARWMRENLRFDQLILECHSPDDPNSGWVHCSYRQGGNRQQALVFDGTCFMNMREA